MRGRLFALAVLALPALADTWIRVSSPSVEIFTDSGEKTARAVLHRFETLRSVFAESNIRAEHSPARVFVFAARRDYMDYEIDRSAAAYYESRDGEDLIVALEDTALQRNASHEYLHLVIEHSSAALPHWMNEGVSDFYSTISIGKTTMRVGETIPGHLALLANQKWMSAEDLALGSSADGPIFYAESWALVHMLTLSPDWKAGMPRFVTLLNEGQEQDEAFKTAFGKSMQDALKALHPYLRNPKELKMPAPPMDETQPVQVTRLAPLDIELALADLALGTQHPSLARSHFLEAAKKHPESPAAVAGLGSLALAENRQDDAQREFERAIAMGSREASTYFELGMLTRDNALLEKTLTINPNFAEAHFLLGVRATDNADFPSAIDHLRRAIAIQPRRFTYWHALSYAQAKSGDRQSAAESARRAAILASNSQEEQMAAALTQLASEQPPVAGKTNGEKPRVITPPSWQNPKGDRRLEGTLLRVDCDATPVRLVFSTNTGTLELAVKNPSQVVLINAEGASTNLACGDQSRPVAIEYIGSTLEITRIEFQHVIMKR